ncbi:MAG: WD40/YVTN/BNR-like repeat-containing protein [Terriglobales bacterium]
MTRLNPLAFLLLACSCAFSSAPLIHAQQYPEKMFQEMRWRMIGPFRAGRTRAAAGVPSQPNVFYMGAVNGGVWKSDDYGHTWTPIFDAQPTQSIGDIAVAPSDPNILYVASGEGLPRPDLSVGNGIYKSTDAGKTWTHLGLEDGQQIPALAVDPRDPNRVFAAVLGHPYGPNQERGIFRSTDGGKTWQKVLYKDENTGGADVQIDPSNPDVVYASLWQTRRGPWEDNNEYSGAGGGLFKSTDGGSTWRALTVGLPRDLVQVHVAIAPSQPSRLYAVFSTTAKTEYASGKGLGFYRSDDGGANWSSVTDDPRPKMKIGGGDLPIVRVDPKNADVVYSTSLVLVRSTDGGKSWTSIRGAPGGDDYQNLWINPNDPNTILLVSDQGALVTVNGGRTWSSWYNQPTAQLYHAITDHSFPYKVCGGQQESGSVCISSRGNDGRITFRDWHPVGVIEYGYVAPDPLNTDIVYGAGRNEVSRYHWSTGQKENITPIPIRGDKYRTERTEPIVFSPLDPHLLYYASNILFKTTDGGATWTAISPDLARKEPGVPASVGSMASKDPKAAKQRGAIYALAPSFKSMRTLWAGTDDGLIWLTRDGGKNWRDITPLELTPWSKVTQLEASHFDNQSAYASVSRFRVDDLHPYIYRTHDGGKSWHRINNGLPDYAPVDTVREDPVRKGLLFAGTETGVWMSFDDGDHWQPLQLNLPHTSMRDLWIHESDLIVATHGRSFWILDNITPLRQASASVMVAKSFLFQPAPAYRVQRDANTDTPLPPDEPAGKNPPDGAVIDYFLGQPASDPVTLEILDAGGKLVRRYSSDDKPELTPEQLQKGLIPTYWLRKFKTLSTTEGMHRWVWDLRYAAPTATEHGYPIAAVPHNTPREPFGPRALPGQYRVRFTADGQSLTAPLTVKMDPRVRTSLAGLRRRFELETRLAALLSRSSDAVLVAQSVRAQIAKLLPPGGGAPNGLLQALDAKLALLLDGPKDAPADKPKEPALDSVNGNVSTLYGLAGMADAPPTSALVAATAKAEKDLASLLKLWDTIKTGVPALNQKMRDASLPELKLAPDPNAGESGSNEE